MTVAMLLANTVRAAELSMLIRCWISPACRAFREIEARARRARDRRSCSPRRARRSPRPSRRAADLGSVRRAARGRERAPRPRLGPGRAPARGARQPGAARGLQRQPAEGHPVLDRARPEPGAVREVPGAARLAGVRRASSPRARKHRRERAARLPPRRRRAAGRQEAALRRRSRRSSRALSAKFSENVLDATNAFSLVVEEEENCRHSGGR